MRPKLQKQSALKIVGRIISEADGIMPVVSVAYFLKNTGKIRIVSLLYVFLKILVNVVLPVRLFFSFPQFIQPFNR
jgi:hypothetical protein